MYGISIPTLTYIYHKSWPNVGKYTIYWAFGIAISCHILWGFLVNLGVFAPVSTRCIPPRCGAWYEIWLMRTVCNLRRGWVEGIGLPKGGQEGASSTLVALVRNPLFTNSYLNLIYCTMETMLVFLNLTIYQSSPEHTNVGIRYLFAQGKASWVYKS